MGDVRGIQQSFESLRSEDDRERLLRNFRQTKFRSSTERAMTMRFKLFKNFKLWVLFLHNFITFATKTGISQSNTSNSTNMNIVSDDLNPSIVFVEGDHQYLKNPLIISHHHFRHKSLIRALRLASHPRGSYKNKRKSVFEDYTWPVKRVAEIKGDIILGGLMMVHEREDKIICGPIMPQGGIQALECMLYTVDWVNNNNFLPGFKLGAYILDDCDKDTYGLEQAVDFIKGSMSNIDEGSYRCPDGSSPTIRHKKITGVLGAASSVTSIQVANLLRLFKIPQVSFFSTSPELSNKNRFEYFLRTVPSDLNQADAMVQIVQKLNWTYISILYEESTYGIQAFTVLEELLLRNDICIAVKERLTKDSGVAGESYYDNILKRIMAKPSARGVIIFGSDQEVAGVMRAVRRNNATGLFSWIGSDGWSARALVFEGNEDQVEGTLSVQPRALPVAGFEEYFLNLTIENNPRNPWFIEFWEHFFDCKWPNSTVTPFNQKSNLCTGEEVMSSKTGYEAERQLQFVSDAVLVFAHALKAMHKDVCGGVSGLCSKMRPVDGYTLLGYLKNVSFKGLSGDSFRFSESGDGPARYNIIHFKQVQPGIYHWVQVGKYENGELEINFSDIRFRLDEPATPTSVCSLPCGKGEEKKIVEGEKCCWHCLTCSKYEILNSEEVCFGCPHGYLPNESKTKCVEIEPRYLHLESTWAVAALLFASFGICCTIMTIIVFIKYNETPVVKASSRELSYVLLFGISMCYCLTFVLVGEPTDAKCAIQQGGINFSFTLIYSAILTKTIRISRIFQVNPTSTSPPKCVSPRSQLMICGCFAAFSLVISAVWFQIYPPKAIPYYPTRDENQLVCAAAVDSTYIIAFAFPMILICVCTAYAIKTRKLPGHFNESKYIGFTIYTTFVIWLSYIPIFFTTSSHVEMITFITCSTISLSATVTLLCLFLAKIYIIVFHPEKNIRQQLISIDRCNNTTSSSTRLDAGNASDGTHSGNGKLMPQQNIVLNNIHCLSCGTQTISSPDTVTVNGGAVLYSRMSRCNSCSAIERRLNAEPYEDL